MSAIEEPNERLIDVSSLTEEKWSRVGIELRTYRDSQWSDGAVDELLIAAYISGGGTPQERARVEEAMGRDQEIQEYINDILEESALVEAHAASPDTSKRPSLLFRWHHAPLHIRIGWAMILGALVGVLLGEHADFLAVPGRLLLRLMTALASPLILCAVIRVLMTSDVKGRVAGRLFALLTLNTVVAIMFGLLVANVIRPGRGAKLRPPTDDKHVVVLIDDPMATRIVDILRGLGIELDVKQSENPLTQLLDHVPRSLLGPLSDNGNAIAVVLIAVAFGIALRRVRRHRIYTVEDLVQLAFDCLLRVLHWVIDLIPLGVFGVVASIVGMQGFQPFVALGWLVIAVLIGLALQVIYYLVLVWLYSWVRPMQLFRGTRDALVMAFSTASSTATMPVTYTCLKKQVGLREESASLGALIGSNFTNDGTALFEAMAALFVSQLPMVNMPMNLYQQLILILTSIVASVGAAGIPEAGLVTMTLVFTTAGLPIWPIPFLLTVDWFLDRCRTTINVLGDISVSCVLDGGQPSLEDNLERDSDPNVPGNLPGPLPALGFK